MNRDFTFGPDRTICLADTEDGEYRIIVTRRPDTGLEVFLEGPFAFSARRCGRPTRNGKRCQTKVAEPGLACHWHRANDAT
jgi:hypothetical protein